MLPVTIPEDARRVEDVDEEIFLLYSQLQATGTVSAHDLELGGLGFVDSRKDELLVRIDVVPPLSQPGSPSLGSERLSKRSKAHSKKISKEEEKLHEPLEITLFQDTDALRSRQGDTGSVLWRASVNLSRLLLSQQRFPTSCPFLPNAALSTCHVVELGAGTGLLSIVLAPFVRRYTATDLPALLPLIRKNQTHNLSPAVLARVAVDDIDWVQLHSTPVPARRAIFTMRAPPPAESPPPPRKTARKKATSSVASEPDVAADRVDLVLVVDCIYNPSLIAPLLSTISHVAGPAPVLVVLELRASDVAHEFLERWLTLPGAWEVWSIPLLGPRFAVWAGKRTDGIQHEI